MFHFLSSLLRSSVRSGEEASRKLSITFGLFSYQACSRLFQAPSLLIATDSLPSCASSVNNAFFLASSYSPSCSFWAPFSCFLISTYCVSQGSVLRLLLSPRTLTHYGISFGPWLSLPVMDVIATLAPLVPSQCRACPRPLLVSSRSKCFSKSMIPCFLTDSVPLYTFQCPHSNPKYKADPFTLARLISCTLFIVHVAPATPAFLLLSQNVSCFPSFGILFKCPTTLP